jgi:dTDP-4-dehydrorhamnose reductase
MRILITGAGGQLGRALRLAFADQKVLAYTHEDLDVADKTAIDALAKCIVDDYDESPNDASASLWPDVIVHAAALTDTGLCEREPELALTVNCMGTDNVAYLADTITTDLLYVSTNEVFDGESRTPYDEADTPNPINAYGRSKFAGEKVADEQSVANILAVVRTSWLYGGGERDFVSKVLAAAREGHPLRFVTDEISTPTSVDDLASAIRELVGLDGWDPDKDLVTGLPSKVRGIYHLTNEGEASRYEWACEILRLAGMSDVPVEPITTEQLYASGYDGPRKPPYSVLANTRARALGITMRDWREALADYFATYRVAAEA